MEDRVQHSVDRVAQAGCSSQSTRLLTRLSVSPPISAAERNLGQIAQQGFEVDPYAGYLELTFAREVGFLLPLWSPVLLDQAVYDVDNPRPLEPAGLVGEQLFLAVEPQCRVGHLDHQLAVRGLGFFCSRAADGAP
jgi:hypothetical protein